MEKDPDYYLSTDTAVRICRQGDEEGMQHMLASLSELHKSSFFRRVYFAQPSIPVVLLVELAENVFLQTWETFIQKLREGSLTIEGPEYTGLFFVMFKRSYLRELGNELRRVRVEREYERGRTGPDAPGNEAYLIRITDYLDGKTSPAGEREFLRDVERDPALRDLFEQELETAALFTSAAAPVRRTFPYRVAAVAAAVVAVAVGVYIVTVDRRPAKPVATVIRDTTRMVTPARPDTQRVSGPVLASRYFQPYEAVEDPVEVSFYYNQYRRGRYADVLEAKPVDYQALDAGGSGNARLRRYMDLYKGLCLLDEKQPARARSYLDSTWTSPPDALTYTAQWYCLLAALWQGDRTAIHNLADNLSRQPNPYQDRARKILQELL